MSYSPKAAIDERATDVYHAIQTRDIEGLYHLANLYKKEGYDDIAEALQADARKMEKEEWAYDEANNN